MTSPVAVLARALRCTEGQAYTLIIGLVVATLLAVGGVPAALRAHPSTTPASRLPDAGAHTGANP